MQNNITIIIPIYNEKDNIWLLIDEICEIYKEINILVIDDFSDDDSIIEVKNKINKKWNKIDLYIKNNDKDKKWLTSSIIIWISKVTTKYFIVMDWDFQHPISWIKDFINLFLNWKSIVVWERKKILFDEKKYRIIISKLWNILIRLRLKWKLNINDPLSWFFWWKTLIFKEIININSWSFYWSWYKFLFEFLKFIDNSHKMWTFVFNFWKRKFWKSKVTFSVYFDFIKAVLFNKKIWKK